MDLKDTINLMTSEDYKERFQAEYQQRLVYDIMAVDNDGLFIHMKFGYSVPRRNGKSEITTPQKSPAQSGA